MSGWPTLYVQRPVPARNIVLIRCIQCHRGENSLETWYLKEFCFSSGFIFISKPTIKIRCFAFKCKICEFAWPQSKKRAYTYVHELSKKRAYMELDESFQGHPRKHVRPQVCKCVKYTDIWHVARQDGSIALFCDWQTTCGPEWLLSASPLIRTFALTKYLG